MVRLATNAIFILGLLLIGYAAQLRTVPSVVKQLEQSVEDVVQASSLRHDIDISVSGRDLTVTGEFDTQAEKASFFNALSAIAGHRKIIDNETSILPVAAPYTASLKDDGSSVRIKMYVPDDIEAANLGNVFPNNKLELIKASGAPSGSWTIDVASLAPILEHVPGGEIFVSDQSVTIIGKTTGLDASQQIDQILSRLKPSFQVDLTNLIVLDPFGFTLRKTDAGAVTLAGKLPEDADLERLVTLIGDGEVDTNLATANADGEIADLELKIARIAPVLRDMKNYEVQFDQAETRPKVIGVVEPNVDLERFAAQRTIAGLDDAALEMPQAFDIAFNLDARDGAALIGLAPEGFDPATIVSRLGLTDINLDRFRTGGRGDPKEITDQIARLQPILEDLETLRVGLEGAEEAGTDLQARTVPFVDPQRIVSFLQEAFATSEPLDVALTDRVYEDGTIRTNSLTGIREQHFDGHWLPLLDVTDKTPEACAAISDSVVSDSRFGFVTGKAEVLGVARVALNKLASVMKSCTEAPEILVELAGHTDDVGPANANLRLSQRRADAIKEQMSARGAKSPQVTARGYGETQPIADNATEAGRAANRRTEINWFTINPTEQTDAAIQ